MCGVFLRAVDQSGTHLLCRPASCIQTLFACFNSRVKVCILFISATEPIQFYESNQGVILVISVLLVLVGNKFQLQM